MRLDAYLFEHGFFPSRTLARAAIMEGLVSADGNPRVKPGTMISGDSLIEVRPPPRLYVSRGGKKLERALECFGVDVRDRRVMDVGSSTGGFTDCLLRRGAAGVVAVDVGRGQLHWRLRCDPRVTVLEGCNARYLEAGSLPFSPSLATVDVSFISVILVAGAAMRVLEGEGELIALVKPQFEAGRGKVGRGGVVRQPAVHLEVLSTVRAKLADIGVSVKGACLSPLRGPKGNAEFFFHAGIWNGDTLSDDEIQALVDQAHPRIGPLG